MILDVGKILLCFKRFQEFFGQCFALFDITEQTVFIQGVYVKWVSWGALDVSPTLVGWSYFSLVLYKVAVAPVLSSNM